MGDYNKTRKPTNQYIKAKEEGREIIVSDELKANDLVLSELAKKLETYELIVLSASASETLCAFVPMVICAPLAMLARAR